MRSLIVWKKGINRRSRHVNIYLPVDFAFLTIPPQVQTNKKVNKVKMDGNSKRSTKTHSHALQTATDTTASLTATTLVQSKKIQQQCQMIAILEKELKLSHDTNEALVRQVRAMQLDHAKQMEDLAVENDRMLKARVKNVSEENKRYVVKIRELELEVNPYFLSFMP
jgi:hypothetical protein